MEEDVVGRLIWDPWSSWCKKCLVGGVEIGEGGFALKMTGGRLSRGNCNTREIQQVGGVITWREQ
jgi:hypothetical protein